METIKYPWLRLIHDHEPTTEKADEALYPYSIEDSEWQGVNVQCKKKACKANVPPILTWQVFKNKTVHLRAECGVCKKYIQYLPQ